MIGKSRNHGGDQRSDRHSRLVKSPDHAEPCKRRRSTGLEATLEVGIQRRQAHHDAHELIFSHVGKNIQIALNQCTFGDNRHWMTTFPQCFQNGACHAQPPFERLIGVGVRTQHDRPRHVP
jgi:hypothetical protein